MHKSRLSRIARKPVSAGAIVLALVSTATQMVALSAATGWSPTASGDVRGTMAASVIRSLQCGGSAATKPAACPTVAAQPKLVADTTHERVQVPSGATQCPDSAPGSSCASHSASVDAGNSAVPDGLPACPTDPAKALPAPGSCAGQPAAPLAPAVTPSPDGGSAAGGISHSPDPTASAGATLTLTSSSAAVNTGGVIFLDATSTVDVTGTPYAIEIFDTTTKLIVAACPSGTGCKVSFSAKSGLHAFVAYVVAATTTMPSKGIRLTSNRVDVRFLGVTLQVNQPSIVAPGKPVTFTANATEEVGKTGFAIELHDSDTGVRLTYCRYGTACSMSLVEPSGGIHSVIAVLAPSSKANLDAYPDVHAASPVVSATWLAVQLDASTTSASRHNVVSLSATANADLSQTPYSIYLYDQSGHMVGGPCHAASCAVTTTLQSGAAPTFSAVIGSARRVGARGGPLASILQRAPTTRENLDIQISSPAVKPVRMLWGVDSCQALTNDPAGSTGLLPQVESRLGAPDFWARYLPNTGNCGGLSPAEISAAHNRHMGILPIYNDYDCSAVSGNAAGSAYALAAIDWLRNDMIPQGTVIAVDIEPDGPQCPGAGNVDFGFIAGWYDVLKKAGYAPAYYGNTAPGSAFANAWCATAQQRPDIAPNSYLWSFEPSLGGSYSKGNAPGFAPYSAGCVGHYLAWQYALSAGSNPDVDQDEVSSDLPLWYP